VQIEIDSIGEAIWRRIKSNGVFQRHDDAREIIRIPSVDIGDVRRSMRAFAAGQRPALSLLGLGSSLLRATLKFLAALDALAAPCPIRETLQEIFECNFGRFRLSPDPLFEFARRQEIAAER